MIGTDSILYVMEKVQIIRDRHKISQSRQKSYADVSRKELEFQVYDLFFSESLTFEKRDEIW